MEGRCRVGKEIVGLTGETRADLCLLEKGDVIVCTPTQVRNSYVGSFDVVLTALL